MVLGLPGGSDGKGYICNKMQETQVQSLSQEDPLEKAMTTHSRILGWRIPMDRGGWQATVHGVTKSQIQLSDYHVCVHVHAHTQTHTFMIIFVILGEKGH